MEIDQQRLRADLEANAEFGALDVEEGRGRTVLTGSDADGRARDRLVDRMEAAGLEVRVDAVGNVEGRWVPEGIPADAEPVAMGSHLDSVPQGGIFDGPLGVYGALEAVRAIKADGRDLARPLAVVSFTEEEGGRFGVGTLGSSVATGQRAPADALALTDDSGRTLEAWLDDVDYAGSDEVNAATWDAWLELHVEQGTRLESAGASVGVVESITGITNCAVEIEGEADHAGTTPMAERADALAAAAEFVGGVEAVGRDLAAEEPSAVATVGELTVDPNVRNVVPGSVEMRLDLRGVADETLDALVEGCRNRLSAVADERPVSTSFERYRDSPPTPCTERCVDAGVAAADRAGVEHLRLHSGAMHDTANVAEVTDAGLLFAPSAGGRSHTPREWTDWADCASATRVLAEAAAALAAG